MIDTQNLHKQMAKKSNIENEHIYQTKFLGENTHTYTHTHIGTHAQTETETNTHIFEQQSTFKLKPGVFKYPLDSK